MELAIDLIESVVEDEVKNKSEESQNSKDDIDLMSS